MQWLINLMGRFAVVLARRHYQVTYHSKPETDVDAMVHMCKQLGYEILFVGPLDDEYKLTFSTNTSIMTYYFMMETGKYKSAISVL